MTDIFGYFDDPSQTEPVYDPGLNIPCPCCLRPLADATRVTISLLLPGDYRSFFFRAHKDCWGRVSAEEKSEIESSLIDQLAKEIGDD
jgi:hypothetical protein